MRNIYTAFLGIFFLVFVMSGLFARTAHAGTQLACGVGIFKSAGETSTLFDFLVNPSVGDDFIVTVPSNNDSGFFLNFGQSAVISEIVPDGWQLTDIECTTEGGATASWDVNANEVFVECLTVGSVNCVYTNVLTSRNIPTLSQWGMIAAAAGLVLIGVFFAVRRRFTMREVG
jgi:hypothetical protein